MIRRLVRLRYYDFGQTRFQVLLLSGLIMTLRCCVSLTIILTISFSKPTSLFSLEYFTTSVKPRHYASGQLRYYPRVLRHTLHLLPPPKSDVLDHGR
ncbi:hypothetical protein M405DRAFT_373984 [Rhizopogon salebrosus TDB-379]|nr:hypothetical protein M405DRAFT_373984 [Rhizopogon salebrosus TDB-379]